MSSGAAEPVESKKEVAGLEGGGTVAEDSGDLKQIYNNAVNGLQDAPPKLDGSWRNTDSNRSLGKLVERVAQQCYYDLSDTLNKMSDLGTGDAGGSAPNAGPEDTSVVSVAKKRLLMEFAQQQRDRFIKTLVLMDWSKNADDMAKLIDLKVWFDKQRWAAPMALTSIIQLQHKMEAFQVPQPNIEGAMEVMVMGEVQGWPDLGYIPKKPLTAKQLLQTMKEMNVNLMGRLTLEEKIPPCMEDWYVANGRATFRVLDEFEVEISVADYDNSSPLYFVDARFLFSPCPSLRNEHIRAHVESRTNYELGIKGLQGGYEFLHHFVLMHKINTLRYQTIQLVTQNRWFSSLQLQQMRNSLIVQYWADVPGRKNWVEFGISSGRKGPSWKPRTSEIQVRWFREGKQVDDALDFDFVKLSMERCMNIVVEKHCRLRLDAIRDSIRARSTAIKVLKVEVEVDAVNEVYKLELKMDAMPSPLCVQLEPITGRFFITPPLPFVTECEKRLNTDANIDIAHWLMFVSLRSVTEHVKQLAKQLPWRQMQPRAVMGVPPDTQVRLVYHPSDWDENRVLVLSVGPSGERWWIGALGGEEEVVVRQKIDNLLQLATAQPISYLDVLKHVEQCAQKMVLDKKEMQPPGATKAVPSVLDGSLLPLQETPDLNQPSANFTALYMPGETKAWITRITNFGIQRDPDAANQADQGKVVVHARLNAPKNTLKFLRKHENRVEDPKIRINPISGLAMKLVFRHGTPYMDLLTTRLANVKSLDQRLHTLHQFHLPCDHAWLDSMSFQYDAAGPLRCQLQYDENGSPPANLILEPKGSANPHNRIKTFLQTRLQSTRKGAFYNFIRTLIFTLPLLRTLDRLENSSPKARVFPRSSTRYAISYHDLKIAFEITVGMRPQSQKPMWLITIQPNSSSPQQLMKNLRENLFLPTSNGPWTVVDGTMYVDEEIISAALERIHDFVKGGVQA
ncbi:MED14-domain-containing protein [Piedraia hortae CBS 480.64]|uniref:Mediator of RNA polymerase II transcription subunit 14 n=1 Tax=Piedraia hortae CBS 480.64 TaxID=1314780 RepID=A0A6A7CCI2_9PEZI|nr:MED14-domain-containing protein [Piedraia hortae CBS 480.64]